MRAHQIMTRKVITVKADASILDAANLMLRHHISGLPVIDDTGRLIGIVSEGDFMRRGEIGTQGPRIRWLDFLMGAGRSALGYVRGSVVVGIVTRADLLRAVASLARDVPDPTADDDHIRDRVIASIEKNEWQPMQLGVTVRDGIVHLSGMISDERFRQATIVAAENVAGVKLVHDHLYFFGAMSGLSFPSPEDEGWVKAG